MLKIYAKGAQIRQGNTDPALLYFFVEAKKETLPVVAISARKLGVEHLKALFYPSAL